MDQDLTEELSSSESSASEDEDCGNESEDTGKRRSWEPHMGMKPSRRHGCGSDNEVDLEVEDDLPYGAATEVNSGMVELMWDAYQNHLTRKAAEWAVHKQKSHRRIAPEAMMSVHTIVN